MSPATLARLPVYLRALERVTEGRAQTVSSELLAELAGTSAVIVRKDLSFLGTLGTRGAGYDVASLHDRIATILGADRAWPVAIVGMGNVGTALANYPGLAGPSFVLSALFDVDPEKIGCEVAGMCIRHLDELAAAATTTRLSIAIITTPASVADEVAGRLVDVGIRSILNFAPVRLAQRDGVTVRDVDVGLHLLVLSYGERLRLEGKAGS